MKKLLVIIMSISLTGFGQNLQNREVRIDYSNGTEVFDILIEKNPKLSKKQGIYSIIAMDGRILKRGNDLDRVLKLFGPKLMRIVKS